MLDSITGGNAVSSGQPLYTNDRNGRSNSALNLNNMQSAWTGGPYSSSIRSIAYWIYHPSFQDSNPFVFDTCNGFSLDIYASGRIRIWIYNTGFDTPVTETLKTWTHYVWVLEGGQFYLYCNSVSVYTRALSAPMRSYTGLGFVGGEPKCWGLSNAYLDDLMVFNRALNSAEVTRLFSYIN